MKKKCFYVFLKRLELGCYFGSNGPLAIFNFFVTIALFEKTKTN